MTFICMPVAQAGIHVGKVSLPVSCSKLSPIEIHFLKSMPVGHTGHGSILVMCFVAASVAPSLVVFVVVHVVLSHKAQVKVVQLLLLAVVVVVVVVVIIVQ